MSVSVLGFGTTASAQQPAASMLGARVKFDLVSEGADAKAQSSDNCEGTVAASTGDTLLIAPSKTCAINGSLRQEVSALHIEAGNRGSRGNHLLYGILIGAVTGGVIGRVVAGDGCRIPGCDDAGFAVGVITTEGIALGTIVGGVVGLILPAGTQWRALPHIQAVLIAKRASGP